MTGMRHSEGGQTVDAARPEEEIVLPGLPSGNRVAVNETLCLIPHTAMSEMFSFHRVGITPRVSDSSRSKRAGRCPRGETTHLWLREV